MQSTEKCKQRQPQVQFFVDGEKRKFFFSHFRSIDSSLFYTCRRFHNQFFFIRETKQLWCNWVLKISLALLFFNPTTSTVNSRMFSKTPREAIFWVFTKKWKEKMKSFVHFQEVFREEDLSESLRVFSRDMKLRFALNNFRLRIPVEL